ncbi:hypothetical protein B2G71_17395 [Novosphingobium sp. PC22D]|uniref:helix-turn-helix domain-containing protein n=1 Tax=Novosphingobium sp. PC22D TaxID=1962403 RepID=UPI000BF0E016|nr:DUF4019 domain-containing protein [Novosphingobium sp. PC22D]PEQ11337.1 hypothetical protein B2G71_17395 [Novosphingobium sp. PC22D]
MQQPDTPRPEGIQRLSEREKETLRLLLAGHEAKSIAVELGLSVHTINDRLREARKKLGVTSSREAARLLARAEQSAPENLGGKDLGMAGRRQSRHSGESTGRRFGLGQPLVWLGGGILVMSLILAAAMGASLSGGGADAPAKDAAQVAAQAEALDPARRWVALLDEQNWRESWQQSGAYFRSRITADQWAATIRSVREPLGAVRSRVFGKVTRSHSLPGAPDGDYELIEFNTAFANKKGAVETVVLARGSAGWNVVGYFIR